MFFLFFGFFLCCLMFRVALNISPRGKLVRRLSVLKSAIEQFASRKKLIHSSSFSGGERSPRDHNVHDDFSFRIISPKLKEKIRQRAFSKSINTQAQQEGKFRCYVINKILLRFTLYAHTYASSTVSTPLSSHYPWVNHLVVPFSSSLMLLPSQSKLTNILISPNHQSQLLSTNFLSPTYSVIISFLILSLILTPTQFPNTHPHTSINKLFTGSM